MIVFDADGRVLGRLASAAAKNALLGHQIAVVNCGKAIISGKRADILRKYHARTELGQPQQGPFVRRRPDQFVRRIVGSMLPKKQEKGRNALGRVKCYMGFPAELQSHKLYDDSKDGKTRSQLRSAVTVMDICREMGMKS